MARTIIYNPERAERVIRFLELLPIIDGPAMGKRMTLGQWQRDWIYDIYAWEWSDTGYRVVRRTGLTVARKNMKSLMVAGLLLCHLVGPESETNGQVFSAANDREQAAVIFNMCAKMIAMTPALQRKLKVVPSTKTIYVQTSDGKSRGSTYKALSAEVATKHGLGPSFFVYDELGEARLTDELWDTLLDGQQARAEPLAITISTQNPDPQHPLSILLDDGSRERHLPIQQREDPTIICHIHAADEDCDLMDEEQWIKANPACRDWKSLDPIRTAAMEAVRLPSKEQNFRRRYLNQRVSKTVSLITAADWKACGPEIENPQKWTASDTFEFEPGEPIYLGLDMSTRTDLTALVAVSARDGARCKAWFWKPADLVKLHTDRDRFRYDVFEKQGWLLTSEGRTVNPGDVARKIVELVNAQEVLGLAYDRHKTDELIRLLDAEDVLAQEGDGNGLRIVPWGQGFVSMGLAIDAFEQAVLDNELHHDGNPILTWNVMNAVAVMDPAGNRKLSKDASRFRIDGAVALAMAMGLKAQDIPPTTVAFPWADENFSLLN